MKPITEQRVIKVIIRLNKWINQRNEKVDFYYRTYNSLSEAIKTTYIMFLNKELKGKIKND